MRRALIGVFTCGALACSPSWAGEQTSSSSPPVAAARLSRTYTLYHDLKGDDAFVERGEVLLTATSVDESPEDGGGGDAPSASPSQHVLAATVNNAASCINAAAMDALVARGGLYRVKAIDEVGNVALASVPACSIRRANFREQLVLLVGPDGELLSLSMTPLVSPLAPSCSHLQPLTEKSGEDPEFKTKVFVEGSQPGMTVPLVLPNSRPPPGLTFFQNKNVGVDDTEAPKHQSFLLRYWYIIVPLCFITLFSGGAEEPPPASAQQAGGPSAAGGGAAVAAAAGPSGGGGGGGGGNVQRRGKRG